MLLLIIFPTPCSTRPGFHFWVLMRTHPQPEFPLASDCPHPHTCPSQSRRVSKTQMHHRSVLPGNPHRHSHPEITGRGFDLRDDIQRDNSQTMDRKNPHPLPQAQETTCSPSSPTGQPISCGLSSFPSPLRVPLFSVSLNL